MAWMNDLAQGGLQEWNSLARSGLMKVNEAIDHLFSHLDDVTV